MLRYLGFLLLGLGFLGLLCSGMPFMSPGPPGALHIYGSLAAMLLGLALIGIHFATLTSREGRSAVGFTLPRLALYAAAFAAAWWFLLGPKANAYPRIYGLGALVAALVAGAWLLPLLKLKQDA
ncbi:MAG: hypothetical protein M5U26_17870 [Planctomycetota bacterium]|nr:hypothetical protein [Planctomycetota bacterium]